MPSTLKQPPTEAAEGSEPAVVGQWVEPEWLRVMNAEVARLSALSEEERQREWEALSPEQRAAYDASHDEAVRNIEEQQRRRRGCS